MKLSEYKNEQAIEVLGKLLTPLSKILSDKDIKALYAKKASKLEFAQALLLSHPSDIVEILAILDDTPVEEYKVSMITLPKKLLEILNDEELASFFSSQGQSLETTSSGSAMANTEATEGM